MHESLAEYRQKLIRKIVASTSEEQVRRFIETAIHTFTARKINGYIIDRFLDKLILELEDQPTTGENLSLSNNIHSAIQLLLKMNPEFNQSKHKHSLFS